MTNVLDAFLQHVAATPNEPCWQTKSSNGQWQTFSFAQVQQMVERVATVLQDQGVTKGTPVVVWANTCMEWVVVDMANWYLGAITVPIYTSTTAQQSVDMLENCQAALVLADNTDRASQAVQLWQKPQVAVLDMRASVGRWIATPSGKTVARATLVDADLASIVYTSGTTGEPKGVALTHGNFSAEVQSLSQRFPLSRHYTALGFLPLSHIVARAVQCFQLHQGFVMAFAESIEKVSDNLKEVRPHFFVSVPRIFEKIEAQIQGRLAHSPLVLRKVFDWGLRLGGEVAQQEAAGRTSIWLKLRFSLVRTLLFRKIFAQLGGRVLFTISGGAPLVPSVGKFFRSIGLMIYEGYGLTETSAAVCLNYPGHNQLGTVGPAVSGAQFRIDSDGEILVKGPMVFQSYYKHPEATKAAFTDDGYFRTGDIGEFTSDGYLRITDRKKDLIVTANGKKIAPQPLEQVLMQNSYVDQAMVYGDKKPYITALIVPNRAAVEQFSRQAGIADAWEQLVLRPEIVALFQKVVDDLNATLARYETIKHFKLLPHEFSIQRGELTPTLKIRRKVVQQNYQPELTMLYT